MTTKKLNKYKLPANPKLAEAMRELRRSNAAGTHLDKRTKRKRTRLSKKNQAIEDSIKSTS